MTYCLAQSSRRNSSVGCLVFRRWGGGDTEGMLLAALCLAGQAAILGALDSPMDIAMKGGVDACAMAQRGDMERSLFDGQGWKAR